MLREREIGMKFVAAEIVGRRVLRIDRVTDKERRFASVFLIHPGEAGVRLDRPAIATDIDDSLAVVASGWSIECKRACQVKLPEVPAKHQRKQDLIAESGNR